MCRSAIVHYHIIRYLSRGHANNVGKEIPTSHFHQKMVFILCEESSGGKLRKSWLNKKTALCLSQANKGRWYYHRQQLHKKCGVRLLYPTVGARVTLRNTRFYSAGLSSAAGSKLLWVSSSQLSFTFHSKLIDDGRGIQTICPLVVMGYPLPLEEEEEP